MWPKPLVHTTPKMLHRIKWARSFPIKFGILFLFSYTRVLWAIPFSKLFPIWETYRKIWGTQSLGEFWASIKRHLIPSDLWLWFWYGLLYVSYQNQWEPGSVIFCSSLLSDKASTIMFCYKIIFKRENSDWEREILHSDEDNIDSYFHFCICSNFTAWFVCCFDAFYLCWHLEQSLIHICSGKIPISPANSSNCSPSLT